jgi:hypothetical protein
VDKYLPDQKWYAVSYEDGDEEELTEVELVRLFKAAEKRAEAGKTPFPTVKSSPANLIPTENVFCLLHIPAILLRGTVCPLIKIVRLSLCRSWCKDAKQAQAVMY